MKRQPVRHFSTAPTLDDIERLATVELRELPLSLRRHTFDISIRVTEFPDQDTIEQLELESPFDILGLYTGAALPARSIADVGRLPDLIHLYRRPLLDYWCDSGEELDDIVRHVLIHEIGHHFGFSDEDMERLEDEADHH